MTWTLNVGNLDVEFLGTKSGALGVKFSKGKDKGHSEVYAPAVTKKKISIQKKQLLLMQQAI